MELEKRLKFKELHLAEITCIICAIYKMQVSNPQGNICKGKIKVLHLLLHTEWYKL